MTYEMYFVVGVAIWLVAMMVKPFFELAFWVQRRYPEAYPGDSLLIAMRIVCRRAKRRWRR